MNLYFIQIIEHNIERVGYIEREKEFDEERTIYLKIQVHLLWGFKDLFWDNRNVDFEIKNG